jgi:hypothetical protein
MALHEPGQVMVERILHPTVRPWLDGVASVVSDDAHNVNGNPAEPGGHGVEECGEVVRPIVDGLDNRVGFVEDLVVPDVPVDHVTTEDDNGTLIREPAHEFGAESDSPFSGPLEPLQGNLPGVRVHPGHLGRVDDLVEVKVAQHDESGRRVPSPLRLSWFRPAGGLHIHPIKGRQSLHLAG